MAHVTRNPYNDDSPLVGYRHCLRLPRAFKVSCFCSLNKTHEMQNYCVLFQLLHPHVSVYTTILSVLIEYNSVVMCKVQYI